MLASNPRLANGIMASTLWPGTRSQQGTRPDYKQQQVLMGSTTCQPGSGRPPVYILEAVKAAT